MKRKGKHIIGGHSAFNAVHGPHQSASEKGYPAVMDGAVYHFYTAKQPTHHLEQTKVVAYTTFVEVSEGVFLVGNTWVHEDWRGEGLHGEILKSRNDWLQEGHLASDIYTLLNPQDTTKIHQLRHVVSKLGYKPKRLWLAKGIPLRVRLQIWRSGLELWGKRFDS